jgi:hypothetical protein
MDFRTYNGIDYTNSLVSIPMNLSWDNDQVDESILGGAVSITWEITDKSPTQRVLEIKQIRFLDLIDLPSIPGAELFEVGETILPFYVGYKLEQTLVDARGTTLWIRSNSKEYTYTKYEKKIASSSIGWPVWLVQNSLRLLH